MYQIPGYFLPPLAEQTELFFQHRIPRALRTATNYAASLTSPHLPEGRGDRQLPQDVKQRLHEGLEHGHHVVGRGEDEPRQGEVERRPLTHVRRSGLAEKKKTHTKNTKSRGPC